MIDDSGVINLNEETIRDQFTQDYKHSKGNIVFIIGLIIAIIGFIVMIGNFFILATVKNPPESVDISMRLTFFILPFLCIFLGTSAGSNDKEDYIDSRLETWNLRKIANAVNGKIVPIVGTPDINVCLREGFYIEKNKNVYYARLFPIAEQNNIYQIKIQSGNTWLTPTELETVLV